MLKFEILEEKQRSGTGAGQKVSEFVVVAVEDDWRVGRDVAHTRGKSALIEALEWAQQEGGDKPVPKGQSETIAALEAENARLKERADCADGMSKELSDRAVEIIELRGENEKLRGQFAQSEENEAELAREVEALREGVERIQAEVKYLEARKKELEANEKELRAENADQKRGRTRNGQRAAQPERNDRSPGARSLAYREPGRALPRGSRRMDARDRQAQR